MKNRRKKKKAKRERKRNGVKDINQELEQDIPRVRKIPAKRSTTALAGNDKVTRPR